MKHIILYSLAASLLLWNSPGYATVIEFGANGTIKNVHRAVDYLSKERHLKNTKPSFSAKRAQSADYAGIIKTISKRHGIDEALVMAVISVESSHNPEAISSKGAQGLMQLIPETAERFGVIDAFDPEDNIEGGVKYLKFLLDRYDQNIELALAGYNAGEGAVDKYDGIPPYPETISYVEKISAILKP